MRYLVETCENTVKLLENSLAATEPNDSSERMCPLLTGRSNCV